MNLSLTNSCTRRCEYCFQKSWYLESDTISKKEMPLEMAKDIVKWYKKQNFSIMGGEPLMYSYLEEFLEYAEENKKKINVISNISVKNNIVRNILDKYTHKPIHGWLINSDYTKEQKKLFLKNFELFYNNNEFAISTTLLPDSNKILESANRILDLLDRLYDRSGVTVRISPMAPNHLSNYKIYDYTLDISNFIMKIWEHGLCKIAFDCPINGCEIHPELVKKLREYNKNIIIETNPCLGNCPFDILLDGSIIYCSSCNFISVKNYKNFNDDTEAKNSLFLEWTKYWNSHELLCDYKSCGKFNPAYCLGVCAAKNKYLDERNKLINI